MVEEHVEPGAHAPRKGMSGYHRTVLVLICLLLGGSVAARAWTTSGTAAPGGGPPGAPTTGQGFLPGQSQASSGAGATEPDPLRDALPAVTEGSLFALLGFALGYTTRKIFKLGLVLLALGFVAVQVLVHFEVMQVDWSALTEKLNQWVMNVREGGTVQELLTDRIPAAGGLGTGYLLGLRRG